MKVCVLSDSHDRTERLALAAHDSLSHGAEAFLHCGDLVAPETLGSLKALGKPIYLVHGNNSGDLAELRAYSSHTDSGICYYGEEADFVLADRRVFLSHYPHRAHQMATTGRWDLLCCGHGHTTEISRITHTKGNSIVLNPGTVAGIGAPATYALGDLATLEFEIRPVPGC